MLNKEFLSGSISIPNRVVFQPMEGCDCNGDGSPGELTVKKYMKAAESAAGTVWFEANAVCPEGRTNVGQMMLTEENMDAFKALLGDMRRVAMEKHGIRQFFVLQLTHSGRQSITPMIAYRHPIYEEKRPVTDDNIVTDEYLDTLPALYARSALLAIEAGFDAVDVKACHGYLLSELLNSYVREGKYGGSYENRTRLFFDAVEAVRAATSKKFIVGSRFNAYDGYAYPYGMGDSGTPGVPDLTEAKKIAGDLEKRGATLLNVTMGCPYTNHEVNRPTAFAEVEAPYRSIERMLEGAKAVKEAAPEAAVVVSGISFLGGFAPNVTAAVIKAGDYDLAGFGRQTFSYPDLARDIVTEGGMLQKKMCLTCGKCTQLMRAGKTPGCVIYDKDVYLKLYSSIGER